VTAARDSERRDCQCSASSRRAGHPPSRGNRCRQAHSHIRKQWGERRCAKSPCSRQQACPRLD
jgi:hypothetical protein